MLPVEAVARPSIEDVATCCIFASVTAFAAMDVATDPLVDVTSPVSAGILAADIVPVSREAEIDPDVTVPTVVIEDDPGHVDSAVFSTFPMDSSARTWVVVKANGVAGLAVLFPIIEFAARLDIFASVTAPGEIVVASDPPGVVTSPFKTGNLPDGIVPDERLLAFV